MKNLAAFSPAVRRPAIQSPAVSEGTVEAGKWVKTSISMRPAMRRRLRAWAALHDMSMQEVVDAALEAYINE